MGKKLMVWDLQVETQKRSALNGVLEVTKEVSTIKNVNQWNWISWYFFVVFDELTLHNISSFDIKINYQS